MIDESILQQILTCSESGRLFKLTKQELEFYRNNTIAVPIQHPDVRHQQRIDQRPAKQLHLRHCSKTGEEILSVYPDNARFPVYSMEAYKQEMFG